MSTKKAAPLVAQRKPQEGNGSTTSIPVPIVQPVSNEVKDDLQKLRNETGASVADMVDEVKRIYPKYDRFIQSKVEHGSETGIRLKQDAMNVLLHRFAPSIFQHRKPEGRTKPYRVQARLQQALYSLLQRHLKRTGMNTQDYIEGLILKDLSKEESDDSKLPH